MLHKRKNNKWRSALWALLSLILIGAVPVSAGSESAQNSGKGTVVFTERAIGGGPYRVNVMLTRTISEEEPPYIVLAEENGYSGSLNVAAGQYNVRATIVERDAPDDAAASTVNATVYVTAGLDQSVTVYVGTVEDLKKAGVYFGEGDTGYGKTVKEPERTGREGEESAVPASGISEQDPEVIIQRLQELFPDSRFVLTLGSRGAIYAHGELKIRQEIFRVKAVDTTAAGDTFTGFFTCGLLPRPRPLPFRDRAPRRPFRPWRRSGSLSRLSIEGRANAFP